ncbi:DUF192 domain-containing protein [Bdellovibrio sp. 22V]|uniref:DUF192 domain-containing protein n=1 Tax=Bdellovibrio TaxID=958 RepID=UPI002543D520|nr:DUF192 domain-containing protein [Bdellovibrio sp. 22V]WII70625.1 DUF192 domain-containing protein [Bdellovibrio sp. 22V]
MMTALQNKTTNQTLIPKLEVARSFAARGKGLLGRSSLAEDQALWILHCNSIHTFFMKFSIDCVFVDKNLKVKAVYQDVRPWRLVLPVWGASSVIEMASGSVSKMKLSVGDQLYVGA